MALACSAGSRNIVTMIPRITLDVSAPPVPWRKRAATSVPCDCATPQSSDAKVNSAMPIRKIRRRPTRSPTRPARSSRPPNVIR
jgi:hypothetical protein